MSNTPTRALLPLALVIGLQCVDVLVHVATGQVESLRIAASVFVTIAGLAAVFTLSRPILTLVASGLIYAAFNALFFAGSGLINPETDSLRVPLFGFVVLTLILLVWLGQRSGSE